jgi:hypothetical protein
MTMSASMITPELLDALMSPDAGIRSQAETVFQSLTFVDRVQGFLTQLCAGDGTEDARLSLLTWYSVPIVLSNAPATSWIDSSIKQLMAVDSACLARPRTSGRPLRGFDWDKVNNHNKVVVVAALPRSNTWRGIEQAYCSPWPVPTTSSFRFTIGTWYERLISRAEANDNNGSKTRNGPCRPFSPFASPMPWLL